MKRALIAVVVIVVVVGASGWWWARGSLPALDGEVTLSGLSTPVQVIFDSYGVPSIYATDSDDAWFAAGAMHARDRLWQMELYRRVTLGRLSEVMGERTMPIDQRFLTLGLRAAAEAEWQRASPAVKAALESYSHGVNAVGQVQGRRPRPLEMQMLGIVPAPWTPVDSLAVGRLLAWRLAENHQAELVRGALAAKFGAEASQQLAGRYPADAPTVLGSVGASASASAFAPGAPAEAKASALQLAPGASAEAKASALQLEGEGFSPRQGKLQLEGEGFSPRPGKPEWPSGLEWLSPGAKRGNSNNWVVAGRKTKSGRAILANDPHLQIEFPSVWYEMHIVAADLDVAGVTIPGVPFIALGHNARIAWGMTNTGADVQDLYLERVDVGKKRVMYRGQWVPVEVTATEIPVRGKSPVPFEIWKTRHGPIFADAGLDWDAPPAWLSPAGREAKEQRAYSIRWDAGGDLASSFEGINRANNWETFTSAVNTFAVPSSNIVYADVDGNIGYVMSGQIPVRSSGDGTMPLDGNNGDGEWVRTMDTATLPRSLNPASGYITSSNNEIDRGFDGLITRDWAAPFRAIRLNDRLSKANGIDLDGMGALQNYRQSDAALRVMNLVRPAIEDAKRRNADAAGRAVLEQLLLWDRVVDDRPVVSLYEAFEDALWRRTFIDDLGEPLFLKFYEWAGADRPAGLYAILSDRQSKWFDDIATVDRRETRDDMFLLAAADAEERLQGDYGRESNRSWGRVHGATFAHPLGSVAAPLGWLFSRGPVPITGDGTTIMRVSWNRLRPFAAWEHPSWRQLFEVGDWDHSRVILPAGQSGNPLSPNYFDQNELWREGRYRTQAFSRAAVSAAAAHRLLLVPGI
ncbi:MAG: penicillin acylase family protein [Vicinamibacterales bacterium]